MPRVTVIPASINPLTHMPAHKVQKRRVAGYARVSTDSDEQYTSYEAQVDYYTQYIKSRSDWEFVSVYTDEGISGCSTKHREGFREMVTDALNGKIDLIVTKSVSRFARNTVDSLVTIRQLKEKGVEVYFEKENIYTFDGKGELLLTIMSSLAQEESRSISENVTWGQRKRFADGKVNLPYKHFLGYDRGENGEPVINEAEAEVVRLIYRLFLEGKTPVMICKQLEEMQIPTPSGKPVWSKTTVTSILQNEKYKGDALLQKCFTVDFLSKKKKANEGEVPQYYVENSHPAIIVPEEWEQVQAEFARRKAMGGTYSGKDVLSARLVCEDCGGFFGSKVWHSTDKYRKVIWQCNNKWKNDVHCQTPTLDSETVRSMFLQAYRQLMEKRGQILEDCTLIRQSLTDLRDLDTAIATQVEEAEIVAELVRTAVKKNASSDESEGAFRKSYEELCMRYEKATQELNRLREERESRVRQAKAIAQFMREVRKNPAILDAWDDTIWTVMIKHAIVHRDGDLTFVFADGTEIRTASMTEGNR